MMFVVKAEVQTFALTRHHPSNTTVCFEVFVALYEYHFLTELAFYL